jgi:hypothetical protein
MKAILSACAIAALIAGCASTPSLEGGIVGTGSRPDCEAVKKSGGRTPLPDECRSQLEPRYR